MLSPGICERKRGSRETAQRPLEAACLQKGKIFIKARGVQTRQTKCCLRRSTELEHLSACYVTASLMFVFCSVCTFVDVSSTDALGNTLTFCKQGVSSYVAVHAGIYDRSKGHFKLQMYTQCRCPTSST